MALGEGSCSRMHFDMHSTARKGAGNGTGVYLLHFDQGVIIDLSCAVVGPLLVRKDFVWSCSGISRNIGFG